MDHDLRADDGRTDIELLRVDARRVSELLRSDDSALGLAVRRVVDALGEGDNYAAFSSSSPGQ